MNIGERIAEYDRRLELLKGHTQTLAREVEHTRLEWALKMLRAKLEIATAEKSLFLLERYLNNGSAAVMFPGGSKREVKPYATGDALTTFFNARGDIWRLAYDVARLEVSP